MGSIKTYENHHSKRGTLNTHLYMPQCTEVRKNVEATVEDIYALRRLMDI
jgi:ABC-type Mn2+/Zn2+ transport system ATPase subunit